VADDRATARRTKRKDTGVLRNASSFMIKKKRLKRALFDYTIYPAALFHKDATIKAARTRDIVLTKQSPLNAVGPQTIKSPIPT
jgi:hypothetical protein